MLFNSSTGDYLFCCDGQSSTGRGTVSKTGSTITLSDSSADRRVQASVDVAQNRATASLRLVLINTFCTITDKDIRNNNCSCQ